mgnify:CR=1 FL=1
MDEAAVLIFERRMMDLACAADRIATALESLVNDAARCGHGATGLCMACVIQNDLMRPR